MTPYSTTYTAEIIKIVAIVAAIFELDIDISELEITIGLLALIASSAWTLWERYKKGGVSILGVRN